MSSKTLLLAAVTALVVPAGPALAKGKGTGKGTGKGGGPTATYEVTITNLTSAQPMSPPVLAVSYRKDVLFKNRKPSSYALKEISENGNNVPVSWELTRAKLRGTVFDWKVAPTPLVPEGRPGNTGVPGTPCASGCPKSETVTITANNRYSRLSWASMLVCTNDGFAGVAGLKLPKKLGATTTYSSPAWETGTERNTERYADMMPPCQSLIGISDPAGQPGTAVSNLELVEAGVVHLSAGITGAGQLDPATYGWTGAVASIAVKRVS